jgi:hypothetical protein
MFRALGRFTPVGRATAALWAWRNRRELGRWLGFAWRAVPPWSVDRDDLLTEARLRASLSKDERTRGLPTLAVRVRSGEATLFGRMSPDLHDVVYGVAERTKGVRRIECRIGDKRSRGPVQPHVHTGAIPSRRRSR